MFLPTPLKKAPDSLARGREVFFKREDRHDLGSFKWRGALPAVESYAVEVMRRVVDRMPALARTGIRPGSRSFQARSS